MTPTGERRDALVITGRIGSAVTIVCLGRVDGRGDPAQSAAGSFERLRSQFTPIIAPLETQMAGHEAFVYALRLRKDHMLTEWIFAHAGWLYAAGIASNPRDPARSLLLARQTLTSWQWIEDPAQSCAGPTGVQR